jgi:hypothetical protein
MDKVVRLKNSLKASGIEFVGGTGDDPGERLWKK